MVWVNKYISYYFCITYIQNTKYVLFYLMYWYSVYKVNYYRFIIIYVHIKLHFVSLHDRHTTCGVGLKGVMFRSYICIIFVDIFEKSLEIFSNKNGYFCSSSSGQRGLTGW